MHQQATQDSDLCERIFAWEGSTNSRLASFLPSCTSDERASNVMRKLVPLDTLGMTRLHLHDAQAHLDEKTNPNSIPRFDFIFSIETPFLSGRFIPIGVSSGLGMDPFRKGSRPVRIDSPPLRRGVAAASPSHIRHVLCRTCCCSADLSSTVCCFLTCWTRQNHSLRERRWEKRT